MPLGCGHVAARNVDFGFGPRRFFPIDRLGPAVGPSPILRGGLKAMGGEVEVQEATERATRQTLDAETQTIFDGALGALDDGRVADAVSMLRDAHDRAPDHARIRSTLGLAVAREGTDFSEARTLCEDAAKQEFFNPDLYLNLAKVYLRFDRRSEALRYLRRGQMIDPGHEPIRQAIASLGRRKLPIVPFLPRRHAVNRALGTARSKVFGAFFRA